MKNRIKKFILCIIIVVLLLIPKIIFSSLSESRQILNNAFEILEKEKKWSSKNFLIKINKIIQNYKGSSEYGTAQILMVGYLLGTNNSNNLTKAEILCNSIIKEHPETWQSYLAYFYLSSILGLLGDYEKQIKVIKEALMKIDFNILDKSKDIDLNRLKSIFPFEVYKMQEILKMMLANAYCRVHRIDKAEEILKNIKDKEMIRDITRLIEYEKKALKYRERIKKESLD